MADSKPTSEVVLGLIQKRGAVPGASIEDQMVYEFLEEEVIDSIGLLEFIMELESQFGIRFEPSHLQSDRFRTLGGIVEIIDEIRE